MEAFTKKDIKPSFTPCFFKKSSLYALRSSIARVISHSWKVFNIAAVFWAPFNRSAIVLRILVSFSRCSSRFPDTSFAGVGSCALGLLCAGFSSRLASTGWPQIFFLLPSQVQIHSLPFQVQILSLPKSQFFVFPQPSPDDSSSSCNKHRPFSINPLQRKAFSTSNNTNRL